MRNNYVEILQQKIEIPIIQRDYAQGRTDAKTSKIRKEFLDVLFDLIRSKHEGTQEEIELDFIYGFNEKDGTFIPIDGQQRITTLWLLYWLVARKENISEDEIHFLSNFWYETRHSTTEFCKGLVKFQPDFSFKTISEEIKDQSWYFDTWAYDPSIQAMLTVLDDLEGRYDELQVPSVWNDIAGKACPFYFYKLDMDKVGLSDDLYIKMNSRGKPLTEFEYFKAGFSLLLKDPKAEKKFASSIDGDWIDAVWHIVHDSRLNSNTNGDDLAKEVDDAFLNLFNFITSVICFEQDIKMPSGMRYVDTIVTAELLERVYSNPTNQNTLFDTLDAMCTQHVQNPLFWNRTFYYNKEDFDTTKTRLFFQHGQANLLTRCLTLSLFIPEQILLHACLAHLKKPSTNFEKQIRVLRNLVVNSDSELRDSSMGSAFMETEAYIQSGDLNVFKSFRTEQVEEEKKKGGFLLQSPEESDVLKKLEDSEILRGNISIIPLDGYFTKRADQFLKHFDEFLLRSELETICKMLLCFGDYSQDDGDVANFIDKADIRRFFTTGYNKTQLHDKTRTVLMDCLDHFITNPNASTSSIISTKLVDYASNPKDWKYYFLKYPSFWKECSRGYYSWSDEQYCIFKMGKKQFNGYHWDPFLYEVVADSSSDKLILGNDGKNEKLLLSKNKKKLLISSKADGFLFENGMSTVTDNTLLDDLRHDGTLDSTGLLIVSQNSDGIDLEDRVVKLKLAIEHILNK